MTDQLVFDLAATEPPSFSNFLPGRNAEALASLEALAAGSGAETGILLWGAPGVGKTHLLCAAARAAAARGAPAAYIADPDMLYAVFKMSGFERGQPLARFAYAADPHLSDDEVLTADLDLEMIAEVRKTWQFFRDRRPDMYESLVKA